MKLRSLLFILQLTLSVAAGAALIAMSPGVLDRNAPGSTSLAHQIQWLTDENPDPGGFDYMAWHAMARHRGPIKIEEQPLIEEMWAFVDTGEILARWQASVARRLHMGKEVDPIERQRVLEATAVFNARYPKLREALEKGYGTSSQYINSYTDRIDKASVRLTGGALAIKSRQGPYNQVFPEYWREEILERRELIRRKTADDLSGITGRERARPPGFQPTYLSSREDIDALLQERNIHAGQSLRLFARSVMNQLLSGRTSQLRHYFDGDSWPPNNLAVWTPRWTGWQIRELGTLMRIWPRPDDHLELTMPDLLLENQHGDLWTLETGLVLRRVRSDRYTAVYPGTWTDWERRNRDFRKRFQQDQSDYAMLRATREQIEGDSK